MSGTNKAQMITVIGGTYDELCFEPYWKERYGSGLRACTAINKIAPDTKLSFHTFCNISTAEYLKRFPFF